MDWEVAARDDVCALLDGLAAELIGVGMSVTTHAVPAHPATAILSVAEAVGADLIVRGPDGETHQDMCWVMTVEDDLVTSIAAHPTRAEAMRSIGRE